MNRRDLLKASLLGGAAAPAFAQSPPASSGLGCGDCFAKEVEPDAKDALWQELVGYPAMRMVDGYYPLPTKPGLGIEVDERALARHPFGGTKPFVLLPVHEDGSIASP